MSHILLDIQMISMAEGVTYAMDLDGGGGMIGSCGNNNISW